jgi:hypothetical protein
MISRRAGEVCRRQGVVGFALLVSALLVTALLTTVPAVPAVAAEEDRHGLKGEYYLSSADDAFDFGELKATVVDPNIEFPDLEPIFTELTGRNDDVTTRWTGRIEPRYSETYTFSMIGDNGFRLWIDNQLIIDHWVDDWDIEITGTPITLEAGRKYDFKVEHFENWGGSNLRLRWESPSQEKEIVPPDAFYLPEGFDPPGPIAASLDESGSKATLQFDQPLGRLPVKAAEHLVLTVGGTAWPAKSATRNTADPSIVELELVYPVPAKAGSGVRTSYDGEGGIQYADGSPLEAYARVAVTNNSTYVLTTRWADDVNPDQPLPEYPRPQLVRDRWQSLNGRWQFAAAEEEQPPPVGQDLAERIVVPYPVESTLSGIGRHEDRMWYRRTFTVPKSWKVGKQNRLLLHLDAVDWQSTVYVNGKQVGTHSGGYDRFTVDVTDALKPHGRQELIVGVFDPTDTGGQPIGKQRLNPSGIWYTSVSGIWQSVWMEPVATAHITRLHMQPDVAGEALALTVEAAAADGMVVTATARQGGRVVGTVTGPVGGELRLPVPKPRLWSPQDPFLYDLSVVLKDGHGGGKPGPIDAVRSYFGMRTVSVGQVDGTTRMLLNGEPVFQIGPLDQGFWPDGIYTAPTDIALRYDIEQTKRLGFNATRKHVKVEPDRWYYWADKLGLLVWQDMPSKFHDSAADRVQFEIELRELVEQHQASPSIVMWVPFNEGWGQYDQARIADLVKDWDPTRLVNNMSGINCCGAVDGGNGDVIDYHIYPGPGTPGQPSATRAAVLGEYGGLGMPVIGHTWSGGGWGYAVEPDPKALTDRYVQMTKELANLKACNGLSAAIYTQITDVETELNGLMTYDRAVTKPIVSKVRAANRALANASGLSCDAT